MCIVSEVKGQISTQHRTAPHQTTLQPPSLPLPLYKRERKGMGGKRKEGVLALLAYVSAKPAVVWDTEHAACTNISPVSSQYTHICVRYCRLIYRTNLTFFFVFIYIS